MFITTFTGKVFSVEVTDEPGPQGQPSKIAQLTFTVTIRKWNKDTQAAEYTDYWCKARAYDRVAERWANYERGQVIEGVGRFEPSPYIDKKTGEPAVSFRVFGVDSHSPLVEWTPKPQPAQEPVGFGSGAKGGKSTKGAARDNELEIANDDDWK